VRELMYPWVVFLHIAGVFGFLLSHGASVAVLFRIRRERDREKIRTLLEVSGASMVAFYAPIVVLLAAGVIAGFLGNWSKRSRRKHATASRIASSTKGWSSGMTSVRRKMSASPRTSSCPKRYEGATRTSTGT
jgi:hypothetical protein